MRKIVPLLIAAALAFSLTGCGASDEMTALREEVASLRERVAVLETRVSALQQAPSAPSGEVSAEQAPALSEEHQRIADAVTAVLGSDLMAQCRKDYADMMGSTPREDDIADIIRYQIGDFEGEKMDCYLVNVHADIGMADKNMLLNSFQIFVDAATGEYYDSLTVDAIGYMGGSLSSLKDKATYLLWGYGNMMSGNSGAGSLLNSSEIITELSADDVDAINNYLK